MNDRLQKVDLIRDRMDVGYAQATEALDAAEGDVVAALAHIERHDEDLEDTGFPADLNKIINNIAQEVGNCIDGRKVKTIEVKLAGHTIKEVPVFLAGLAAVLVIIASSLIAHLQLDLEMNERPVGSDERAD